MLRILTPKHFAPFPIINCYYSGKGRPQNDIPQIHGTFYPLTQ